VFDWFRSMPTGQLVAYMVMAGVAGGLIALEVIKAVLT